jgi:hypothetical protein
MREVDKIEELVCGRYANWYCESEQELKTNYELLYDQYF